MKVNIGTLLSLPVVAMSVWALAHGNDKVYIHDDGLIRVVPAPVAEEAHNPAWPAAMENGFWERANNAIERMKEASCGQTVQDHEKRSYPAAMFRFVGGDHDKAIECLQARDYDAGKYHQHTLGIDYYHQFTLKGQMRKYFWFGKFGGFFSSSYRDTMFDAGKIWTEQDPATRPHPVYGTGNGEYGYGPEAKGYWVQTRMHDNLRAMREVSVYLMAEETGNEETRQLYKEKIKKYVVSLYHTGMSEWDTENYLSHTMAPYLSLYDFAEDPDVVLLAKAACDFIAASAALKYYRGGFGGPCSRDYGMGSRVFGAGASHMFALYFGDIPYPDPNPSYDDIHAIMSGYRPPRAVVEVARKNFARPVEMLNTKPHFENWRPGGDSAPEFHETMFFGRSYYMGTVVSPTNYLLPPSVWPDAFRQYTISAFKLLAKNSSRGVDFFEPFSGQPITRWNRKKEGDQIAQYQNLAIWLRPSDTLDMGFMIPKTAQKEVVDGVWFFSLENTWIAVRPINLGAYEPVEPTFSKYPDEEFLVAPRQGSSYVGFSLEVGEKPDYASYDAFRQAVLDNNQLDLSQIAGGVANMTGSNGYTLSITHNDESDIPAIIRNGSTVDWDQWTKVFDPQGGSAPVSLGWKEGTLQVTGGGARFSQTVTAEGAVSFSTGQTSTFNSALHTATTLRAAIHYLPSERQLVIGAAEPVTALIVRPDGKVLFRGAAAPAHQFKISTRGWSSGVYTVIAFSENRRTCRRLVIGK